MINRVLEKIESSRKLIKFRRTQLEQTASYLRKASKQNKEELTRKFSSHIDALKAYFDEYRKRHSEMLNDALCF